MNSLQKFYIGVWAVFASIIAAFAITGTLTMLALTVFGFGSFGLIFLGMMCVLPSMVNHSGVPAQNGVAVARVRNNTRRLLNAWAHPVGIEMSRPKFH